MDRKQFEGLGETLKGFVEKASFCAPNMKQRSMTASFVFHREAPEVLSELIDVPETELKLIEGRVSFRKKLFTTLGDNYTGRKVSRLLEDEIRWELGKDCTVFEPENAKEVCEALSGYSGGKGPFYIVEEVFLAQFDEVTAVFYVGNDE